VKGLEEYNAYLQSSARCGVLRGRCEPMKLLFAEKEKKWFFVYLKLFQACNSHKNDISMLSRQSLCL
jgi:hypothetical protein